MNRPQNINIKDWELLNKKYPNNIEDVVKKLSTGFPIQYLIGNVEFLDTIITVDKRALIPRFETEYLVSLIIDYAKTRFTNPISVIDLGTGTGCIAIALKKALDASVAALDISSDALDLAKLNAKNNNVEITFIKEKIETELSNKYDIIVSNPPYIPKTGYVAKNVLEYEPHLALFAPDSGIYFYKQIINKHLKKLKKPGLMAFEIGDNEEDILTEFLLEVHISNYEFKKDLTGRIRYLFIYNE